jgi:hypothetical protein
MNRNNYDIGARADSTPHIAATLENLACRQNQSCKNQKGNNTQDAALGPLLPWHNIGLHHSIMLSQK